MEPRALVTLNGTIQVDLAKRYNVTWAVALSKDLSDPVASGVFETGSERDYTVKASPFGW